MSKTVCKYCCKKCANRDAIEQKYFSLALGVIDESYCSNANKVTFEDHSKSEIEIYCKNYKEN